MPEYVVTVDWGSTSMHRGDAYIYGLWPDQETAHHFADSFYNLWDGRVRVSVVEMKRVDK